ncbi:branched-chain amino acid transport system substrate-binding protein [Desulfotomaculum arcticum]|uniref:Branched-chain amino acid transport system substrate-binding protein n=1 Tax=Desulfotruncus arcticus DSM 17038 TaxID=1121424 RepID=A0A1I2V6J8_9FIRM|nr:ABC transporter substrate-binding protein [Desulfotruncus arcticus]SFG84693.1 branched-chain amino acid transport system substrate-binding protein [Desulfotomaculum arcticum] [Desulfotruncus arcticus DSM 17038]
MKKLVWIFSIILVLGLLITGCSGQSNSGETESEGAGDSTIKIGGIFNITGGQASLDQPSLNAFQLAADEINASGGVNGQQIEVISVDGKSDPATTTSAVQELVDVKKVKVVAGLSDSTYVLAAGPIAQQAGIPFITSGATAPEIPDQVGDYMFLAPFGDNIQAYAAADFALNDLNADTAWVLTDTGSDYTLGLAKYFKERYLDKGGKISLEDKYNGASDVDFSAQITRLKNLPEQPKVLFVSAQPDKCGLVVKQLRDMGVDTPVIGGDGYDTPDLVKLGGVPQTNNTYFTTHVSLGNTDGSVTKFVDAYKSKYNKEPENAFAALAYDTMYLIADAIGRAGSDDPTAIRDALLQTDGFKGVTGTISYQDGSRIPLKSVTIMKVDNGNFEFVKEVLPN